MARTPGSDYDGFCKETGFAKARKSEGRVESSLLLELVGYLASVLIAISLTMRSILKLRLINLIGAACFTVYGVLIAAYPVAVLNGLIVGINLYYLYEMKRSKSFYTVLETGHDAAYLDMFLRHYAEDIRRFFPSFEDNPGERHLVWFILRDLLPVGLFIAAPKGKGTLLVELDYVIPGYRDLQPGRFLYEQQSERFGARGISYLETVPETDAQRQYLRRMGFEPVPSEGQGLYRRSVL